MQADVSSMQRMANTVFSRHSIPVEVIPSLLCDDLSSWKVIPLGGSLESVLEQLREQRADILADLAELGMVTVSRQDALFMYTSYWLEWVLVRGPNDPYYMMALDAMERWCILHAALENRQVQ
jgi:hypothetical protein